MNTLEILNDLSANKFTKKNFYGVFPSDKLPIKVPKPCLIIVNNATSSEPGEHWTCFFLSERSNIYFDSYGIKAFMPNYQLFLKNNCKSYKTNIKRLQGTFSMACAKYCLVFLLNCCQGIRMENFLNKIFGY